MSIGNLKDNGNKGNNYPYQLKTLQLLSAINASINALPGVDYETRTTTYEATGSGTGYVAGNIIVRYDIIDVATSTVTATVWFNQTTQTTITPAPAPGNLTPITAPSGTTGLNGGGGNAVNIQDGGNTITVDGLVATYPLPPNLITGAVGPIIDLTLTPVIPSPGPATDMYVTQILVTNSHATVGTVVRITYSTGAGILYQGYAAPAGGGFSLSFPTPLLVPAGDDLEAVCLTTGSSVYVSASGFYL